MGKFLKIISVSDILEYDAFSKWNEIKIGDPVTLEKGKEENAKKIVVKFDGVILGTLPKNDCGCIKEFADNNWPLDKLFDCKICRKNSDIGEYDQQLHILVQIKKWTETDEVKDSAGA